MSDNIINMEDKVKVGEKCTITDDQAATIYNTLEAKSENSNKEILEEAKQETEAVNYEESTAMETQGLGTPVFSDDELRQIGLDDETIEELKNAPQEDIKEGSGDYLDVFKEYDMSNDDATNMFKVIMEYKETGDSAGLYDKLPKKVKELADGFTSMGAANNVKLSKDEAAKTIVDSFINDAKFGKAMDDFNEEMNELMINTNDEYHVLMQDYIDELFNSIDKIRLEDPEKADQIEKIKQAFEDSNTFAKQLEFLDRISAKKIKKALNSYDSECFYFNKKVNTTDIKIPDIRNLYPIIKKALPGFTESQIKSFIIVICKSSYKLDTNNIAELAYIYRAIERIFAFRYIDDFESDTAKEVFGNVSVVIKKIINL